MQAVETGVIKTFSAERGYGFIIPDNGENDLFFHATKCAIAEQDIQPGMAVEFQLVADIKQVGRYRAIGVAAAGVNA